MRQLAGSFPMHRSAGFTLIELMVVVVIATILAMIAIPSYNAQMRESRRTEARTALLELSAREERYFATNAAYSSTPASLGYTGAFPQDVGSGYYEIDVAIGTPATTFTATAAPQGTQGTDGCGTFQIDNTGNQTVTGSTPAGTCWQ